MSIEAMGLASFIDTQRLGATRADGLVSLKYNQIERRPMHEPCVQTAADLVVDETILNLRGAMAYRKFWNLGEEARQITDWSTARVAEKLDSSLMTLYRRDGRWCTSHRAWLPDGPAPVQRRAAKTFRDVDLGDMGRAGLRAPRAYDHHWYMFELKPAGQPHRRPVREAAPGAARRALPDFTERDPAWLAAERTRMAGGT